MTIAQALKQYPDIEADLLLGHVLKQSKEFLYMHDDEKLSPTQEKRFLNLTAKRKKGVPIAYLIGYKYFYGLKFKVNRNVLIPRPETEWLVNKALKIAKRKLTDEPNNKLRIIDVGTGSGCIATSLAKNIDQENVEIFATDISEKALLVAKQNAKQHQVSINFSQHDLLRGVRGTFDIIIANLPYVPVSDYKKFYENLKYEPKSAITDGTNNFELVINLLKQAMKSARPDAILLLEIDPATAPFIKKEFKASLYKDIHDLQRFVKVALTTQ